MLITDARHQKAYTGTRSFLGRPGKDRINQLKEEQNSAYATVSSVGTCGGSVAEWLERWTCNSEAQSSSPALTASWICSW